MKFLVPFFLVSSLLAAENSISDKALNQSWNVNSFVNCVSKTAVAQLLDQNKFLLVSGTGLSEEEVSRFAYVYITTKNLNTQKRESFRLALKSLDEQSGWIAKTFYDLETAPYTAKLLATGVLTDTEGQSALGVVDIQACSNN